MATITDEGALRAMLGSPNDIVVSKITDRLNDLTRQFVERSPFLCIATSAPDGRCDVSPPPVMFASRYGGRDRAAGVAARRNA